MSIFRNKINRNSGALRIYHCKKIKKTTCFHFFLIFRIWVLLLCGHCTNITQLLHKALYEHNIIILTMFYLLWPMLSRNENPLWRFTQRVFGEFFVIFFADFVKWSNDWLNAVVRIIRLKTLFIKKVQKRTEINKNRKISEGRERW
jgi:hypothetical protein